MRNRVRSRGWWFLGVSLVVLLVLNLQVVERERILSSGDIVRLELRPRDPRSLMQGDYMTLTYSLTSGLPAEVVDRARYGGKLVVRLDQNRVASFVRLDDGSPLTEDEQRLVYARRALDSGFWGVLFGSRTEIWPGPNAFFFEEGTADLYTAARYAELRVSSDGEQVLTGLLDADLRPLGRSARASPL